MSANQKARSLRNLQRVRHEQASRNERVLLLAAIARLYGAQDGDVREIQVPMAALVNVPPEEQLLIGDKLPDGRPGLRVRVRNKPLAEVTNAPNEPSPEAQGGVPASP